VRCDENVLGPGRGDNEAVRRILVETSGKKPGFQGNPLIDGDDVNGKFQPRLREPLRDTAFHLDPAGLMKKDCLPNGNAGETQAMVLFRFLNNPMDRRGPKPRMRQEPPEPDMGVQ